LKIARPSFEKPQKHTVSAVSPLEAGAEVTPGELIAWPQSESQVRPIN
jgi:hypothetical protein